MRAALGFAAGGLLLIAAACAASRTPHPQLRCRPSREFAPWDRVAAAKTVGPALTNRTDGAGDGLISLYQRYLRAPRLPGTGCPFAPSCSSYGRQAIQRYGLFGIPLLIDRLFIREHSGLQHSYRVRCELGERGYHDPVP